MTPFTHLLAATDLSLPARAAVERAARIAAQAGAHLHLVHVAEPAPIEQLQRALGLAAGEIPQRVSQHAGHSLQELAASLQATYGVTPTLHQASGELLAALERTAADTQADLLVLGARGGSVARHLLLGSTAERLAGRLPRCMLIVRQPPEVTYRKALVAVDFSPASLASLQHAHALAPTAQIVPLHASEPAFESMLVRAGVDTRHLKMYVRQAERDARRQMDKLVRDAALPRLAEPLLLHGHPVSHILDQEEELGCQLLVVGKAASTRVADFLLGSISRRVLTQARSDVLVSVAG